ncbi:unnamed protein product [Cylindrotheca closterium]|uniref:Uncharacterized protein n=1 Tax=Cylindrotheca closterium TaxID=2856 RepID=A0AAD2FKQ2_9STRA|nr:unnamed protein product [Cylindrotheca closterium]
MSSNQQRQEQEQLQERISQSRTNVYEILQHVSIPVPSSQEHLQLPHEIYLQILEYLPQFPLQARLDCTTRRLPSRRCFVTDQSCQTDAEGMIHARSHQPLPHLQFFRFRSMGFKVGFGVTTNPSCTTSSGMVDSCGFFVSTKCFHFGKGKEENVTTLLDWLLRTRYHSTSNAMGVAVDYAQNQLLLNWPNRQDTLRIDLPEQFQNKVLYPMVQVWGGSAITVLPEKVMAADAVGAAVDKNKNKNSNNKSPTTTCRIPSTTSTSMEDDSNTSTVSTTPRTSATVTLNPPTTLPLTQSITRDSWCSEWMSLCKSRGLPWDNNHRRWAAPAAPLLELPEVQRVRIVPTLPPERQPEPQLRTHITTPSPPRSQSPPPPTFIPRSILKNNNRRFSPIVDELDSRMQTSTSLTSMTTRVGGSPLGSRSSFVLGGRLTQPSPLRGTTAGTRRRNNQQFCLH